jgi:exodeoxyribonuclease-3
MKIAIFNINNVNKRLANLLAWLGRARPDGVQGGSHGLESS